ncbi:uncharacterized protein [Physcomitrium patens]|uniref:uncharacterized protein isoform X2 n=1 Tax=Physcomitrium patens TaxID=3218 RepID=UPI003CCD140F
MVRYCKANFASIEMVHSIKKSSSKKLLHIAGDSINIELDGDQDEYPYFDLTYKGYLHPFYGHHCHSQGLLLLRGRELWSYASVTSSQSCNGQLDVPSMRLGNRSRRWREEEKEHLEASKLWLCRNWCRKRPTRSMHEIGSNALCLLQDLEGWKLIGGTYEA